MTHIIPTIIVLVYVFGLFAVTWWARRLTQKGGGGLVGYLMAGKRLPPSVAAALLAGLAVGGASTIGVAEKAYTVGLSAGWVNAAWAFGAFVLGSGAASRMRRMDVNTLPELFEQHYTVSARVLGVVGQLALQVVITSLQYVAGGAILHSLMPGAFSFEVGMIITAAVFVGITLIGGFWAAGLTNVINVIVIYVGIILGAILAVGKVGGLSALAAQTPPQHPGFDLWTLGPSVIAAWFLIMATQVHSTQSVIQIGFATRDETSAKKTYLLGGLLILPVGFISAVIGIAAAVLHPGILPTNALPNVVLDLSPFAAGMILAGLWAADVSTASALLMGSATLVCNDLIKRFFAPNLPQEKEQIVCRITVAVLSVITLLLALTISGILKAMMIGLTLATAYTLVLLATLYTPQLCRKGSAFWTLLTTMITLVIWLLLQKWAPQLKNTLPHPIYFMWLVSIITFLLVAFLDKRRIRAD